MAKNNFDNHDFWEKFVRVDGNTPQFDPRDLDGDIVEPEYCSIFGMPAWDEPTISLRCITGVHLNKTFTFTSDFKIGRHPSSDIVLDFIYVGRKHCYVTYESKSNEWIIHPFSVNGITLDGTKYYPYDGIPLRDGSILELYGASFQITIY